jgi:hypothetical protein
MAMYKWVCPKCGVHIRKLADVRPDTPFCVKDNEKMLPDIGGSTSIMERLDNGVMPKIVERYKDAPGLTKEHSKHSERPEEHII